MQNFTAYLQSKNLATTTIKKYTQQTAHFIQWVATELEKPLENIEKKDILTYLTHLENKQLSNRSRQIMLGTLTHYYNCLLKQGTIQKNPTLLLKIRGTRRTVLYQPFTFSELEDIVDSYRFTYPDDKTGYLLVSLCIYQGLRITEWRALLVKDIDLKKGNITIKGTRRTNKRILPLNTAQLGAFYSFLNDETDNDAPLFTSIPDPYRLKIKLQKSYPNVSNFKQIRASIITHWIKTTGLRKAQYFAGHRYISSTETYLQNDWESLQKDIINFHPLTSNS